MKRTEMWISLGSPMSPPARAGTVARGSVGRPCRPSAHRATVSTEPALETYRRALHCLSNTSLLHRGKYGITRTLYDRIIDAHTVRKLDDEGLILLYVDRTVLNEYTSPQAFSGLREAGRKVWNPSAALMVVDHVNPTSAQRTRAMPDARRCAAGRVFC